MGIMAPEAFSILNRLMHHALNLGDGRIGMTRVAQVFNLFLEQTFVPGNMGIVTSGAFSLSCRRMFHPPLKSSTIMTGETIYGRQ
jgi:hypothetical protein